MVAATVAGVSSARAQCTDPTETFVTTVTRTFSAGSAWSIGVSHRACEGLAIGPVFFTPAGGAQQEVLFKGTIAEVHVPYHTGSPRFLDATASTSGLGVGAVALAAAECTGTLFDANHICVQNADGGYGWKYQSSFRTAQAVEIFMSSQLGNYNYINKWTFHDDGSIEPQVGLTGRLEEYGFTAAYIPFGTQLNPAAAAPTVGKSHMHNFYYRLDFDIGGSGNDAVSRIAYNPFFGMGPDGPCTVPGQCGTNTLTQIPTEQAQTFSTTDRYGMRLNIWKMKPMWSARKRSRAALPSLPMSRPRTRTVPSRGTTTPASRLSSVDFPLPLGPRRKTRSPRAMRIDSMSTTGGAASAHEKRRLESSTTVCGELSAPFFSVDCAVSSAEASTAVW
jgi:hypothetical protein